MQINTPGLVVISGKQGSGKTMLVKYIVKNLRDKLRYGIVFCQTAFNTPNCDYIDEKYIHTKYDPQILYNLMKIQASIPKERRPLAFIIFDDCIVDSYHNDKWFNQLITQTRHYNVLVIITTQYVNKLSPMLRENCFQCAIFAADTHRVINSLYESYGQSKFDTYNDFKKYLLENTKDHQFIWYDRQQSSYQSLKLPKNIKCKKLRF
jgi:hypothetical protein